MPRVAVVTDSTCDLDEAMRLMANHGAIAATIDRAAGFAAQAKALLEIFPDSVYRRSLMAVADYTVSRVR